MANDRTIPLDISRFSFSAPSLVAIVCATAAATIWAVRLDGKVAALERDIVLVRSIMVQTHPVEASRAIAKLAGEAR